MTGDSAFAARVAMGDVGILAGCVDRVAVKSAVGQ